MAPGHETENNEIQGRRAVVLEARRAREQEPVHINYFDSVHSEMHSRPTSLQPALRLISWWQSRCFGLSSFAPPPVWAVRAKPQGGRGCHLGWMLELGQAHTPAEYQLSCSGVWKSLEVENGCGIQMQCPDSVLLVGSLLTSDAELTGH